MYNKMDSKEAEEKNSHYSNIVSSLALSYSHATKSEERIRILSCVGNHFPNKDLKAKFHYKTKLIVKMKFLAQTMKSHKLGCTARYYFGPGLEKPPHKKKCQGSFILQ